MRQRQPIFVSVARRRTPAASRTTAVTLAAVLAGVGLLLVRLGWTAAGAVLLVTATALALAALAARRRAV